jgi:hypothetical protein
MRQISEKMSEYRVSMFNLFVDFKAAYDSTDRTQFFKAVEEFQIPRKLRSLGEITLRNVRCKVKTPSGFTDPFDTKKGLRQGDTLFCMLFNTVLEKAVREANLDIRGTILHKSMQILAYADDDVIIARYENAVKDAFNRLERASQKMGLMITDDKTKYMETTCKANKEKYIRINNSDIQRVNQFKYLGSINNNNNNNNDNDNNNNNNNNNNNDDNISLEISHRINMGNMLLWTEKHIEVKAAKERYKM